MATAAAPTYFPAVRIGDRTLVDGGVHANNPGAIALVESKLLWPNEDEILVSLGTGVSKWGYLPPKANSWGLLNWIGPLIDCVFDGSSDSIDYILRALLGRWFDLRLLNDASDIPTSGKNLIIVAAVNNVLHFRIFDGDGKVVVNTDENSRTKQAQQIEDLRKQLNGGENRDKSLWPPYEMTWSDKGRVIAAVTSIFSLALGSARYHRFQITIHPDLAVMDRA